MLLKITFVIVTKETLNRRSPICNIFYYVRTVVYLHDLQMSVITFFHELNQIRIWKQKED